MTDDWTHEALAADDGYRDEPELSELIEASPSLVQRMFDMLPAAHSDFGRPRVQRSDGELYIKLDADLPVTRSDFGDWDPSNDLGEDGAGW